MKRFISVTWYTDAEHVYCPACGQGGFVVKDEEGGGKETCPRCRVEFGVGISKPIEKAHLKGER